MEFTDSCEMKFALVSHVLPPSWSGQAMVLYRLLKGLDPTCYCLITRQNYDPKIYQGDMSSTLNAHYYYLPAKLRLGCLWRLGLFRVGSWLQTFLRAWQISRIAKHEKARAIVACTGDLYDLPAGYLASWWAGIGYYVYLFDDYFYQWAAPLHRAFAQRWEPILMKGATGIIVPNEFLRDEYRRRYEIEPVVIHNPCEELDVGPEAEEAWPIHPKEVKIVYTGAVYHAHYDAFRNLLAAIEQVGRPEIKLHIFTAQRSADLEQENICGPVVYHHHLGLLRVIQVQRQADILFLPLAFNSPIPEVVKTSAPGKMGEYMASGRPILVHAPPDSFLSWYFKKYECGLVVDRNESMALVQAIRRMIEDEALRKHLIKNALACAKRDFDPEVARAGFLKLFQPIGKG